MTNTSGKVASKIKKGDVIIVWRGSSRPQTVTKITPINDPETGAALILIELDGNSQDSISWSPNAEFDVVND
jgi:hypothetical protein